MNKSEYFEKFKDPRWQKKRLEILERDQFACQSCQDRESELHVHHNFYNKEKYKNPWEYPNKSLISLCDSCHKIEHDYWAENNKDLIESIRSKGAHGWHLNQIAEGFKNSIIDFAHEPNTSVIKWVLCNKKEFEILYSKFFDYLAKLNSKQ